MSGKFGLGNIRSAKLTPDQVQRIRHLYHVENWTQGRLAREFEMSGVQIGRIVRGESWTRYRMPIPDLAIKDSEARLPDAPIEPFSEELQAKLLKELAGIEAPNEGETPSVDPIDAYLKRSKEEGSK